MSRQSLRMRLAHDLQGLDRRHAAHVRRSGWRGALSALVLLIVVGYLIWEKAPMPALAREILAADPRWLLAAAAVLVANRVLMALKWWMVLRGEGLRLGLLYLTMVTFVGYFVGRLVPGALGMEAVRIWYLSRDHGIGTVGVASVVIDRATSVASLALVAMAALLVFDVPLPSRQLIVIVCAALLTVFVLVTASAPALAAWLDASGRRGSESRLARWLRKGRDFVVALAMMQGRRALITQAILVGVAVQIVRGFGVYLIFVSLDHPELLAASMAVAPIVMFLTMVPVGVGSIAVGAGAMVLLLEPVGVSAPVSVSASLLADALVLVTVPIGALCFAAGKYWRTRPEPAG